MDEKKFFKLNNIEIYRISFYLSKIIKILIIKENTLLKIQLKNN